MKYKFFKFIHNNKNDKFFQRIMLSSLFGMTVCALCLFSVTWAWFSASSSVSAGTIQTAYYAVSAVIHSEDSEPVQTTVSNNSLTRSMNDGLAAQKEYTITLKPVGSVKSGYCILQLNGTTYYTDPIPEDGFTFTYKTGLSDQEIKTTEEYDRLLSDWDASLSINACWGVFNPENVDESIRDQLVLLKNEDTIGYPLSERPSEDDGKEAMIHQNLTNLESDLTDEIIDAKEDLTITLTPAEGYSLPESVSVSGIETYSYQNGKLTLKEEDMADSAVITITASGIKKAEAADTDQSVSETSKDPVVEENTADKTDDLEETEEVLDVSLIEKLASGGNVMLDTNLLILPSNQRLVSGLYPQITISYDTHLNLSDKLLGYDPAVSQSLLGYTPALLEITGGSSLTIEGAGSILAEAGENSASALLVTGGKLVINSGNFYGAPVILQAKAGSVEINGGFFDLAESFKEQYRTGTQTSVAELIQLLVSENSDEKAYISIKGGTFVNFDPSSCLNPDGTSCLAEGAEVRSEQKDNGDIWYIVSYH